MTALLVALGAAVGAPLRYLLARFDGAFPIGMLAVNTLGSTLFGLFAALSLGDAAWALLGTGFCGAFTSFSTFAVQSIQRRPRAAAAYVGVTVVLSLGGCMLGWLLGTALA